MDIVVLKQAKKELAEAPKEIIADALSLFDELASGKILGMPVSRPLPGIAKGLHELRLKSRAGQFRIFYLIRVGDAIYILHVAHKKSQRTDKQTVEIIRSRLKAFNL